MLFLPMLSIAAILLILGLKGTLFPMMDIGCLSFSPGDIFISASFAMSILGS